MTALEQRWYKANRAWGWNARFAWSDAKKRARTGEEPPARMLAKYEREFGRGPQQQRDPKRTTAAKEIATGARGMAQRGENARESFLTYAEKHAGLTRAEAERALATYQKLRLIRLDHVTGDFHVKHGAYLDREPLRRAAGVERDASRTRKGRRRT